MFLLFIPLCRPPCPDRAPGRVRDLDPGPGLGRERLAPAYRRSGRSRFHSCADSSRMCPAALFCRRSTRSALPQGCTCIRPGRSHSCAGTQTRRARRAQTFCRTGCTGSSHGCTCTELQSPPAFHCKAPCGYSRRCRPNPAGRRPIRSGARRACPRSPRDRSRIPPSAPVRCDGSRAYG